MRTRRPQQKRELLEEDEEATKGDSAIRRL